MSVINKRNKIKYLKSFHLSLLALPGIIIILLFNYIPMVGLVLAFKSYDIQKGILGSPFNGIDNFKFFLQSEDVWRITRNTLEYNFSFIIIGMIVSVTFAIMLFEVTKKWMVKLYQTIFFFPFFMAWTIVQYMLFAFLSDRFGVINSFLRNSGMHTISFYTESKFWPFIFLFMYIWKNVGYLSVIFYAGLMGIDSSYFEAASIDGASKMQTIKNITIPLLKPLIIIMVLLQLGRIFYSDFGMFYFLPMNVGLIYNVTDVIDTYVYRTLRVTSDIGMSSAAGFYQSIVGFLLVFISNKIVSKVNNENALF